MNLKLFKECLIEFGFKSYMLEDETRLKRFYNSLDEDSIDILLGTKRKPLECGKQAA